MWGSKGIKQVDISYYLQPILTVSFLIACIIFVSSISKIHTQLEEEGQNGKVAGSTQTNYFVSTTGTVNSRCDMDNPCNSVETVLNLPGIGQQEGQVIVFKDGIYTGIQKIFNRNLANEVAIRAENNYKAVLENTGVVFDILNARNLKISGFEIRHKSPVTSCSTSDSSSYLIHIRDGTNPSGAFGNFRGADNGYYDSESKFYPNGTDYTGSIKILNNIIHDSYCEDLLKIQNGGDITVRGNMFYNQATLNNTHGGNNNGSTPEEAIDINSVFNVTISKNIFFNQFNTASQPGSFIVVKDSSLGVPHGNARFGLVGADGNVVVNHPNNNVLIDNTGGATVDREHTCDPAGNNCDTNIGSNNIVLKQNVFMSFSNSLSNFYPFLQFGAEDTKYYILNHALVENNLFLGNNTDITRAIFELEGTNHFIFRNNTISGNLPARHFGYRLKSQSTSWKYPNNHVYLYNNIWTDPTGTMGAETGGASFGRGELDGVTTNRLILNNLYWNNGNAIPNTSSYLLQQTEDTSAIIANPDLNNPENINNPRWNGASFDAIVPAAQNYSSILEAFEDIINRYGRPLNTMTAAIDIANLENSSSEDIFGYNRGDAPDIGAVESNPELEPTPTPIPPSFCTI